MRSHRWGEIVAGALLGTLPVLLVACDAQFIDERAQPQVTPRDAGSDGGGAVAEDGGFASDAGPASDVLLASATFEGRGGHVGRGSARLVRRAVGAFAVELGADFSTSSAPGLVLVLSTRSELGTRIDPAQGDLELGPLSSFSGAQVVAFTTDPASRRTLWVFCKPFGIEFARAALVNAP